MARSAWQSEGEQLTVQKPGCRGWGKEGRREEKRKRPEQDTDASPYS